MNYKKGIIIFISAITVLRLIFINLFPLLGDEAYYWQWARHLDWAYYEQGPVVAIIIWIFTLFTKINTLFTIRLGAVVLSTATLILSYLIYKKSFPSDKTNKENFFNILFISSSVLFASVSILMMHDTVMIFFYALFIYQMLFVLEKIGTKQSYKYWALAGVILALGTMSKYTLGTIYIATLVYIIFSGNFKKSFKGLMIFTGVYAISMFPSIYWNITHDLATLKYLFIRGGSESVFTLKYIGELIGAQISLTSPFLFIFFIAACIHAFKNKKDEPGFFFTILFLVSISPFLLLSLKNRVEANWPAFTFLPLYFITARYIFSISKMKALSKKIFVHVVYVFGFLVVLLIHIQISTNIFPIPMKNNPMKKAYGYKELAVEVDKVYNNYKGEGPLFIAARHYHVASLVAFYSKMQPEVYTVVKHESRKNYRFWNEYNNMKSYNTVYVYGTGWEHDDMRKFYESSENVYQMDIYEKKERIAEFKIDFNRNYLGND